MHPPQTHPETVTKNNKANAVGVLLRKIRHYIYVFGRAIFKLLKSTPILVAIISTAIVFLGAGLLFDSYNVRKVLNQDLTTTVTAAAESLSFSLIENTQSSWILPPGKFLLLDEPKKANSLNCRDAPREYEDISQGYSCTPIIRTRLVVEGAANITHKVDPDGKWTVEVGGSNGVDFTVYILDSDDVELARSKREISFEVNLKDDKLDKDLRYIRIPIIAATGQIGSDVRYASSIGGEIDDFWEPSLLSGNVTTYALNYPEKGKYEILSERLDSGDIIGIFTRETTSGGESDDTIWGVATIREQTVLLSDTTEIEQYVIYAVLHTTHRALSVNRFGSSDGHEIRASGWSIISKWPNGQETWVAFMSIVLVLTFVLQLADFLKRKPLKSGKKGKKHKKRKGNGD